MNSSINVQPPMNIKIPEYMPKGIANAYWLLENEMKKGKDAKFCVYYDPDIDGLFSGLLAEEYLERLGFKNIHYKYYLHCMLIINH